MGLNVALLLPDTAAAAAAAAATEHSRKAQKGTAIGLPVARFLVKPPPPPPPHPHPPIHTIDNQTDGPWPSSPKTFLFSASLGHGSNSS
ncbi:hypothetical protein BDZ91DRAFT_103579 [Kalaharituber pfeilii]|nr:hypothetical protein BDZ91DRAFT_103579 [Kalaharituber pfeilii]